jgi:hypothetical protein
VADHAKEAALNKNYDHTITARSRCFRPRIRAEQEVARKAARTHHRAELDQKRATMGLPPAKTSTERARQCRGRQAAAELVKCTDSWYSSPFANWQDGRSYLMSVRSDTPVRAIESVLETTRREAQKWQLCWNRFVITNGSHAARVKRAILWQILDVCFGGDMTHIEAAMEQAATRLCITITESAHPTQVYQEKALALDMSQIMLREGGILNVKE